MESFPAIALSQVVTAGANIAVAPSNGGDSLTISVTGSSGAGDYVEPGTNVTFTGAGDVASPFVISADATNLLTAGANVTLTGDGTVADPYQINSAIADYVAAGNNVTFTGAGTSGSPFVIASNITGLLTAGTNVTLTGAGTVASPYQISSTVANYVSAGTNVTFSGAGTAASPFVIAANITSLVTAGTNVTLTGAGTAASPYQISSTGYTTTTQSASAGAPFTMVFTYTKVGNLVTCTWPGQTVSGVSVGAGQTLSYMTAIPTGYIPTGPASTVGTVTTNGTLTYTYISVATGDPTFRIETVSSIGGGATTVVLAPGFLCWNA